MRGTSRRPERAIERRQKRRALVAGPLVRPERHLAQHVQRAHQHGLAQARDAFEQDVPARDHGRQHQPDQLGLADHQLSKLGFDAEGELLEAFRLHPLRFGGGRQLLRSWKYWLTSSRSCSGISWRSTWLSKRV